MTQQRYKELRSHRNFLYLYFLECGGRALQQEKFQQYLNLWIQHLGMDITTGIRTIFKFLDNKFGYVS